jgi:dihydrofolate synthase/folylpolyglutamate synthase
MSATRQALISAGANLGDRFATLCRATARLRQVDGISRVEAGSVFETEPVGVTDQPEFLNLVLAVETTLAPEALLHALQDLEDEFGRVRETRWGPRTLDLDLLVYEGETRSTPELTLPHPRLFERAFVTVPLGEVLGWPRFQGASWDGLRSAVAQARPGGQSVRRRANAVVADAVEALEFLRALKQRGVHPGLDRMRVFAAALGNPELKVPVIHIAGTNGKGSVAAMLESVLRGAGWRTGLYTSPHLIRFGERIQIDRSPLPFEELVAYARELKPVVEALASREGAEAQPSYFEFMTGLAFLHFARRGCDVVIAETGMGGLLDATNIVSPELSVITSIGHDHAAFLGDSLESIATHKAGIIKPGRPVVIGRLPAEAERVMRVTAGARGSVLRAISEEFGSDIARYPSTNLLGEYQRVNAATATLAARSLDHRWRLTEPGIAAALQSVAWPARWQQLQVGGRSVVIDTSHNSEGASVLDRALAELVRTTGRRPVVVTGVLGADRAGPILETVCRHAEAVHLVIPRQSRACGYAELEALIPTGFRGAVTRDRLQVVIPSRGQCLPSVPADRPVVFTGSIYLAGEVLARLDPTRGPVEPELQDF